MTDNGRPHSQQNGGRTLVVIGYPGAGTATIIGSMLYKCGGIEMPMLEKLEKKGVHTFDKAAREIRAMTEELYFYTPKNRITVTDDTSSAGGVVLIVTPGSISEQLSTKRVVDTLKDLAQLFARGKAHFTKCVSNDEHDWSESVFSEAAQSTKTTLSDLGISAQSTPVLPVSGLRGDNLIEVSPNSSWYSRSTHGKKLGTGDRNTFVAVLDEILS